MPLEAAGRSRDLHGLADLDADHPDAGRAAAWLCLSHSRGSFAPVPRSSDRVTYANVVASLALFAASPDRCHRRAQRRRTSRTDLERSGSGRGPASKQHSRRHAIGACPTWTTDFAPSPEGDRYALSRERFITGRGAGATAREVGLPAGRECSSSRDPQLTARPSERGDQPRRRRELSSDAARSSCSAVTTVTGKPSDSTR